ncbi:MAG: C25 family cysteine peptidase [Candidatus Electryonea clarkiae]|nr:C25 family cysteine peptidase [Candidatus Electryonea clarkiae]MDP8287481.1 C25 family cysteine peptidase [Candidatus Electryonea clarkiae]
MKHLIGIVILSLLFVVQVLASTQQEAANNYLPLQASNVVKSSSGLEMSLTIAEPEWKPAGTKDDNIVIATLGEYGGQLEIEGFPAVPVTSRIFRIPPNKGVVLEIIDTEYETYTDIDYAEYFNSELPENMRPVRKGEDTWYPGTLAEVTSPAVIHDFRTSNLVTYPVQVNTARREVRVYSKIDVDIRFEGTGNRATLNDYPTEISEAFLPWYRQFLGWNDNELDDYALYRGNVQLVLKDDDGLWEALAPWIEWKRQKGWEFDYLTDEDVDWDAGDIREELRDRYAEKKFDYVVIIGDATGTFSTPAGINITNTNYGIFADYYYQMMDDDDIYQDVIVGRISVQNVSDVNKYVRKVILYERDPYMDQTDWYLRGCGLSVADYAGISTTSTVNYAATEAFRLGYTDFDTFLGRLGPEPARSQMIPYMNRGVSFYAFRGGIADGMQRNHIQALTNVRKLFVACELTCSTGKWSVEPECISEAWIRAGSINNPKGGIAAFGLATSTTHCGLNNGLAVGVTYSALTLRIPEIGQMLWGGQNFIWRAFHPDYATGTYTFRNFAEQCNLMGDPLCWLWTAVPEEINVEASNRIELGTNAYSVEVTDDGDNPIEGAWVTLYKVDDDEDVIATGKSGPDGTVTLNAAFRYTGEAMLTVTNQNCIPNRTEIDVVDPEERVSWVSIEIQDDGQDMTSGNDNGVPEAGETVGLSITLGNYGDNNQSNIEVTATCDDPLIEDIDGSVTINSINAGQEGAGNGLIFVDIAPQTPHRWLFVLDLEFETDDGTYEDQYELMIEAPKYLFVQADGNEDVEPQENATITIEITNIGGSDAAASEGYLFIRNPYGFSVDPTGNFAAMERGESAEAEFVVSAHEEAVPGFMAAAQLVVTTEDGNVDTVFFSLPMGTRSVSDPCGPDRYGYYAFDMEDTDYEHCPEYDWVEINPNVNGNDYDGHDAGVRDLVEDGDDAEEHELPFTVQYYGEEFDMITISSNGWAAFGEWADEFYAALRNAPIPGPYGPPNMLAPYWDERSTSNGASIWYYYDEPNDRYIIEWYRSPGWMGGNNYGHPCTYEIIIYDHTGDHITWTEDNEILFQYEEMDKHEGSGRNNPWWTTGITDGTYTDGLQYMFWRDPSPGAVAERDFDEGLAILFSTDVIAPFGGMSGTVTDLESGELMEGVLVQTNTRSYFAETDANGYFEFDEVMEGNYVLQFLYDCYNMGEIEDIIVQEDSVSTVEFAMTYPLFESRPDTIYEIIAPDSAIVIPITLLNDGNGAMEFEAYLEFNRNTLAGYEDGNNPDPNQNGQSELDNAWSELLRFELNTDESRHRGVAFVRDHFYVSGSDNFDPVGPNKLYKYTSDGEYVGVFDQPVPEEDRSSPGMYGLTWDGEFLYGVDEGKLHQMAVAEDTITLESSVEIDFELDEARYITYDPDQDLFWMGSINSEIFGVNRNGEVVLQYVQDFSPRGLAWYPEDPEGFKLYFFTRGTGNNTTSIVKMNSLDGEYSTVTSFDDPEGILVPVGADLTFLWDPSYWVFASVLDNGENDSLRIWEVSDYTAWATLINASGTLEAGDSAVVELNLTSLGLPLDEYNVWVHFNHIACVDETENIVPATMQIWFNAIGEDNVADQPLEWELGQIYPNPFNPVTNVRFALKNTVFVNARVYNLLGQEIAILADRKMSAGYHTLAFDGSDLASGMYFLRFEAGPLRDVKKMILMK